MSALIDPLAQARTHLESLLAGYRMVHLTRAPGEDDQGNEDQQALSYVLVAITHQGRRLVFQACTLAGLLRAALFGEPCKACSRCGETVLLTAFPIRKDSPDGRASGCRRCDRERQSRLYNRAARGRLVGSVAASASAASTAG